MKSVLFLLLVACSGSWAQQPSSTPRKPLTNFDKLKDGDLVFIASNSPRAGLIQKLTGSKFSHCGIVFLDDQHKPRVYEGAGANSDIHKTIDKWQTDESAPDSGSNVHQIYTRRLKGGLTGDQVKTLKGEAARMHKTHYDFAFQMGDPKNSQSGREYIYCSELIYRAFQSLNVTLGTPLSFKEYYDRATPDEQKKMDANLNAKDVQKLRNPPGPYRMDEFVISPRDIDISDKLEEVTDETPD
jgi:Permuted papain-like amidase enzyme, YaeF/YiiX, C92 family